MTAVAIAGVIVTFALGGLWWGIGGAFLFLVVVIIALTRTVLRLSDTSPASAIDEADVDSVTNEDEGQRVAPETSPSSEPPEIEAGSAAETDAGDPYDELLKVAFEGDVASVRRLGDAYIATAEAGDERLSRRGQVLMLLTKAGDGEALSELERLSEENPLNHQLVHYVATALELAQAYEQAGEFLERRADLPPDEDERRTNRLLRSAEAYRNGGRPDEAERITRRALTSAVSDVQRASVTSELAQALLAQGRRIPAIAAMEEVVRLNPSDTSTRFTLAYQYSTQGLRSIAIYHYKVLLGIKESAMALNNLGVELQRADLVFRAFDYYQRSANRGETLAASNIAGMYMTAGAREDAQRTIEEARKADLVNPRVFEIEAKLAGASQTDEHREGELFENGRDGREPFLRSSDHLQLPTGEWTLPDGRVVDLSEQDGVATGDIGQDDARTRVRVDQADGGLRLRIYEGKFLLKTSTGWGSVQGDLLTFAVPDSSSHSVQVIRLTRGRMT